MSMQWFKTPIRTLPLCCCFLLLLSAPAGAGSGISIEDDAVFGSDAIIRDHEHGRDFLRLDFTVPYSYNEVLARTAPGGEFAGWQIASKQQMMDLGAAADVWHGSSDPAVVARAEDLRDNFCFTCVNESTTHKYARGLIREWFFPSTYPAGTDAQLAFSIGRRFNVTPNESDFRVSGYASGSHVYEETFLVRKTRTPQLHALVIGMDHGSQLNGRGDAEAVWNKLKNFNNWASTNPDPMILNPYTGGSANLLSVEAAIADIRDRVLPGDEFVFYFAGHGGYPTSTGGDETPVWVSVGPWDAWNKHDEYLWLTSASPSWSNQLSDDRMKDLFDNAEWADVDKLFLFDACHSGGFWGDDNASDTGDLEKISNAAVLAASPEWGVSFSIPGSGRGLWTTALEGALSGAALLEDVVDGVKGWDWSEYLGMDLPLRVVDGDPTQTYYEEFSWDPMLFGTEDFEFNSYVVPEPATLSALALGGLVLLRRRRAA